MMKKTIKTYAKKEKPDEIISPIDIREDNRNNSSEIIINLANSLMEFNDLMFTNILSIFFYKKPTT